MNSLCRYTASRALAAMRRRRLVLFFCHTAPAAAAIAPRPLATSHFFTSRKVAAVATAVPPLIGIGGAAIAADYGSGYLETVPYTNRRHFLLRSPLQEREVAESRFARLKERNARVILDQHHPDDTVRVNDITSRLVQAVHSSLIIKQQSHDDTAVMRAARPASTGHLDGLSWEVMVVKDKRVTAWCLPAGKIIVPTGSLKFFKTDAEVATVIAHEIGHIVARHCAEKVVYRKWLPRPLRVPFLRSMEREADHIGMMLLAAAGFDPRVAPLAFEKLGGDGNRRFLAIHPSNKKRSQLLSETKTMELALELYRAALLSPDRDTE